MTDQLLLIESPPEWRLDESTREVGRRGVARAREMLHQARVRALADQDESSPRPAAPSDLAPAA